MTRTILFTLLAVVAIVAGAYFIEGKGRSEGAREARLEAERTRNDELRESNKLLGAVRRIDATNAEAAAKTAAAHLKEKRLVESERDRALADVDAGHLRLRVADERARPTSAAIVCMPAPGASPSGSESPTQEAGFSGERERAAVQLLAEANTVVVELNKCWRTVRKDRGMPEPK